MSRRHSNKRKARLVREFRRTLVHCAGCHMSGCYLRGTRAAEGTIEHYLWRAARIQSTRPVRVPSRFRGELGTWWRRA